MSADDTTPEPGPDAGIDEIRADIAETREHLGDTVSALGAKLDVKGRAEEKAAEVKESVVTGAQNAKESVRAHPVMPISLIAGVAAVVVTIVVVRRRRAN